MALMQLAEIVLFSLQSSTIENHPPLRPIRSPVLGGVDDMSLFDITEENPADISMTPQRLGDSPIIRTFLPFHVICALFAPRN
jgi:hypothetical protein